MTDKEMSFGDGITVGMTVKRSDIESCNGVVKDIREEVTQSQETKGTDRALLVTVLWDNGTQSYVSPVALEKA